MQVEGRVRILWRWPIESKNPSSLVHGIIGGLIAGAMVASWFLVADFLAGDALRTPALLGGTLFGQPEVSERLLVGFYTIVHFGAFAIIGGLAGWALAVYEKRPGVFLGFFVGVCVLNAVHYVGLFVTNSELINLLPWPHVLGANLVAGAAFATYMRGAEKEGHLIAAALSGHQPVIAEGVKVGILGAGTVAIWFLLIDIIGGDPMRTPAALGSAMFFGADDLSAVSSTPGLLLAFSVVHLLAFAAVGIFLVAVAKGIDDLPSFAYLTVMCAMLLEALVFAALVSIGQAVLEVVPMWSIGLANVIAIGGMAGWIYRAHPTMSLAEVAVSDSMPPAKGQAAPGSAATPPPQRPAGP